MKRFLPMMILACVALASFVAGVFYANINHTSAAATHQSQPIYASTTPYYYLSDPKMLATDSSGKMYLINKKDSVTQLLVFTNSTDIKEYTITVSPKFIKYAGSYLFIFTSTDINTAKVHIYRPNTFTGNTALQSSEATLPTNAGFNDLKYFDVHFNSSTSTYSVFYANQFKFGSSDYTITASACNPKQPAATPASLSGGLYIGGITSDGAGSIYLAAFDPLYSYPNYTMYDIYHANPEKFGGMPLNENFLINVTSLNYVSQSGHFIAIADEEIILLNKTSAYKIAVIKGNTFYTDENKSPLFVTSTGKKVLVIDDLKKSVDEYQINANQLDSPRVIIGHRGQDSGFFNIPQALVLTTENELLVADRSGQIKCIKNTASSDFITEEHAQLDIRTMCYDNWTSVYMFDNNSKSILRYNLNGKLVSSTATELDVIQLLSDPHQNIYIVATTGVYLIEGSTITPIEQRGILASARATYSEQTGGILFAPSTALDITADALGNSIILFKSGSDYKVKYTKNGTEQEIALDNATVDERSPALCFDRTNNKLYYIGVNHVVETAVLETWTFTGQSHPTDYKAETALNADDQTKFLTAKKDIFIYQYPNGIKALASIKKNSFFKLLSPSPEIDNKTFNYYYVMYENSATGECRLGYVSRLNTESTQQPYSKNFGFAERNIEFSARVIYNNTVIYKFPTTNVSVKLGTISKNYDNAEVTNVQGLKLSHKVEVTDSFGFIFYEIHLSYNSATQKYYPDPEGSFVGYVNSNSVIDYYRPESTEKFNPNASVNFPRSHVNGLIIYSQENSIFTPIEGEFLKNNQDIRIIGTFNKKQPYTYIAYFDSVVGIELHGWVETKYVIPYGISTLQLIALIILIVIAISGNLLLIIRAKRKKKQQIKTTA